jgi:hypothetical protein
MIRPLASVPSIAASMRAATSALQRDDIVKVRLFRKFLPSMTQQNQAGGHCSA